jgi:sodium-dependent phosphate cotransporter
MISSDSAAITGLALEMLCTALVQSSSAVVAATMVNMAGMVAGGLPLSDAIRFGVPMILGANIGTTVTNTIVAFSVERGMTMEEFKDTIPGVIVDDVYEALTIMDAIETVANWCENTADVERATAKRVI